MSGRHDSNLPHDDGGPAFPCPDAHPAQIDMTLRDYFAAAALPTVIVEARAMPINKNSDADRLHKGIAWICYDIADAMLAERAK